MENSVVEEYKVYPRRWGVLLIVCFINMSNASIWISFFPVATLTADYFEKESSAINWFSFVFMIIPSLCFVITTYISKVKGLKFMVHIGCAFNFCGSLIKAISTSGLMKDKNTQYKVALTGQIIAAVAQTFTIYVPTKVSQVWFSEKERGIITMILSMSYSLGIVITQVITPQVIKEKDGIPTIDYICFGFAAGIQVLTLIIMTRSSPKTPPSKSAEKPYEFDTYWIQLKETFSSKAFVFLFLMMSCGVGFVAGLNTLTQQIVCAVGYSNEFAGILILYLYGIGYIGALIFQQILQKFQIYELLLKIIIAVSCIGYIGISVSLLFPNSTGWISFFYALFGFFSVGMFPIGLELCVEATYPVDESLTTGLIYLFGQFFAIFVIAVVPALSRDDVNAEHNVCNTNSSSIPQEYSISMTFGMIVLCATFMTAFIFYKPEFRRKQFEEAKKKKMSLEPTEDVCRL